MSTETILTKLTEQCASMETHTGSGGDELVARSEFAFCLGKLPDHITAILRSKYLLEPTDENITIISEALFDNLVEEGIVNSGDDVSKNLCLFASHEYLNPLRCNRCHGRAKVQQRNGKIRHCDRCKGRGFKYLSVEQVKRELSINRYQWDRVYKVIWATILKALSGWENQGLIHISQRLH